MLEFHFVFPFLLRKDRENVSTVKRPSEGLEPETQMLGANPGGPALLSWARSAKQDRPRREGRETRPGREEKLKMRNNSQRGRGTAWRP